MILAYKMFERGRDMSLLYTPVDYPRFSLPNRLVMPPMATAKSDEQDQVTEALLDYYRQRAQGGGIGLVITEHSYVCREGKASPRQVSISRDEDIPGLRRLAEVLHGCGSRAFIQINHAGSGTAQKVTGLPIVSASAVQPRQRPGAELEIPAAMDQAAIDRVIDAFAQAARRGKMAGFDGVEIHSAHGYLLNQFYSPLSNQRSDAYTGASLEGRIRLHLQVIEAVRAAVGSDYPVALRLGACDYMDGGSTVEDGVAAARAFEAAGLDLLDISGGFCGFVRPGATEQGWFAELTEAIRAAVSIPVILTGGITEASAAEALLQADKADLIGVGRAILGDVDWARRAMQSLN